MDLKRGLNSDQPIDLVSKRSRSTAEPTALMDLTTNRSSASSTAACSDAAPMDLSKKPADCTDSKTNSSEVITLSDDEEDEIKRLAKCVTKENGDSNHVNEETAREQRVLIRKLQENLRNEEAKLMLLKQMRHSQRPLNQEQARPVVVRGAQPAAAVSQQSSVPSSQRSSQNTGSLHKSASSVNTAQSARQNTTSTTPQHSGMRQSTSTSALRNSSSTTTGGGGGGRSSGSASQTVKITQAQLDTQKAQRKLALRKQLEKSLLDIPSPVPPPPELNFIPSTATNEFVALVGLEEVVKNIQEYDVVAKGGKPADVKYVFHPFTCVQCKTDFTPVWKRDKPGSKNVICEQCVANNQKSQIRREHTNRLKSAFFKALKQEEDIEREFKRYAANPAAAAAAFAHLVQTQPQPTKSSSSASASASTNSSSSAAAAATASPSQVAAQAMAANMLNMSAAAYSRGLSAAEMQRQQQFLTQQMQAALAAGFYQRAAAGGVNAASAGYPFNLAGQLPANYMQMLQHAARQSGLSASLWSGTGSGSGSGGSKK